MKKILIDINHPAHVHYFKNFIQIMKSQGNKILVISRNKEIEFELLKEYKIPFKSRGKGSKTRIGKFLYMLKADLIILFYALKFKPNVFLSFLHPYPAHVAYILKKPHIAFSDSDHAKLHHRLTVPYSTAILTPECYTLNLGKKHIKFNGYMELCYLHPSYFIPNPTKLNDLNLVKSQKFVILRFISWDAIHDYGYKGISNQFKISLINALKNHARILISSENELPDNLKQFRINLPPHFIHDLLTYASLFIGEGATMASECAMLGTPAILINPIALSTCEEQEKKYSLLYNFKSHNGVIDKAIEILNTKNIKHVFQNNRQKMLNEKIDVTKYMCEIVEKF